MTAQALKKPYDFPVELQTVKTSSGVLVPHTRAVVRLDTNTPLSIVSDKYNLVPHKTVMDAAEGFIERLGKPERHISVQNGGKTLIAELTYKEHQANVAVGDHVGLRVFLISSYTGTRSVHIRLGGIVLSCLNGNVVPGKEYNYVFRHVGEKELVFPDVDALLARFHLQAKEWKAYAERQIDIIDKPHYLEELAKSEILPGYGVDYVTEGAADVHTVWDFLQKCTYFVTHLNKAITPIGKMNRLSKLSTWFKHRFSE